MVSFWEQFKALCRPNASWVLLFCVLCLSVVGIYAIDTTDEVASGKQLVWLCLSLSVMFLFCFPPPRLISYLSFPMFWVVILLLLFVLLPFIPESLVKPVKGARSRISLPFMKFQPSEIAKFVFVLVLAWHFRFRSNYRQLRGLLVPFGIMLLPVLLILKQPDLGSALIFGPAFMVVLLVAGCKLRHLFALTLLGVLGVGLNVGVILYDPPHGYDAAGEGRLPGWMHVMKGHQEKRIAAMLWPKRYADREGFQQERGLRLLSAGGVYGYGKARAARLIEGNALPEEHNDMIYCVIVNRWGLVGGLVVIGLYGLMSLSLMVIIMRLRDPFMRLATVGMGAIFIGQAVIHIGVNVRLLPNTGITLPFVSYGGSSMLAGFMMVGLILNFASRKPGRMVRRSFEFDGEDD